MNTSTVTKADKLLIGTFLILSIGGIIGSFFIYSPGANKKAEILVDGKLAIIEASNGQVRIRQDDSPRQIGVQTGWVSHPPQQVVNLPYRIVVKVMSDEASDIDVIAR